MQAYLPRPVSIPPPLAFSRRNLAPPSLQWRAFAQIAVDDDEIELLSDDSVPALVAHLQDQAQGGAP